MATPLQELESRIYSALKRINFCTAAGWRLTLLWKVALQFLHQQLNAELAAAPG
eukprot:SAG31_NODE_1642_length_7657_cov_3.459402_5_plen_54_part_00